MKEIMIYILFASVALVWGIIIYRIYAGAPEPATQSIPVSDQKPIKEAVPIRYHLILNYRDPFLGRIVNENETNQADESMIPEAIAHTHTSVDWSEIQYIGKISNPSTDKSAFLILIMGKVYLFRTGDTWQGLTVLKSTEDGIYVKYQNASKHIYK